MTRQDLARRQADLLAALVADGPVPAGLDPVRVAVEAKVLARKRRRVLVRLLPDDVVDALGDDLPGRLDAWIAARPRGSGTGLHDDAAAFRASLVADGTLRRSRWRVRSPSRRRRG